VSGLCGIGTGNGVSWVLGIERKSLNIEGAEAETFRVVYRFEKGAGREL
jgi:hypothetical protein